MTTKLVYTNCLIVLLFMLFVGCSDQVTSPTRVTDNPEKKSDDDTPKDDYYDETELRYRDFNYKASIKSALIYRKGDEMNPPIYNLSNPAEGIELRFDDLEADAKDYQYTIYHCDADWQRSDLDENEYMEGFFTNRFDDRGFSINTLVPYTHYHLDIPNDNVKLTKTGNYLLVVFENDPELPVITRRFMIYQESVRIETKVRPSSVVRERDQRQEIDFTIWPAGVSVTDPISDLKVVVMQNNRWDNAISGLTPVFIRESELVYDHSETNVFDGGNEFRFFDMKSLRYKSTTVNKIIEDSTYHVILFPDKQRDTEAYSTQPDINGKYIVRNQQGFNHYLEGEYCWVHFQLEMAAPVLDGNIYVFGGLSDWQFKKDYQLKYNYNTFAYEGKILLKQGYYNYSYVLTGDDKVGGNIGFVEGNHFATENDYTILVYHKGQADRFDRLIGVRNFKSVR